MAGPIPEGSLTAGVAARVSPLADLIAAHRHALLACGAPPSRAAGAFDALVDALVASLRAGAIQGVRESVGRIDDLEAFVREHDALRECVLDLASSGSPPIALAELRIALAFLAERVAAGVASFVAARAERAEAQTAAILDVALDAIISMDAAGHVVAWNPAAVRMFGYTRDEALGRPLAELVIPPHLREAHTRGVARYGATRESRILDRRLEMPAIRRDGSHLTVELTITCVPSGGAPWFTGYLRDITAHKRAEERQRVLLRASEILASSLELHTTLASLVELAVPAIADCCVVEIPGERGHEGTLLVHHVDDEQRDRARAHLAARREPSRVLRTGEAELHPGLAVELLAGDVELVALHTIGARSVIRVPLSARGKIVGALTLASATRRYAQDDLDFARELAVRAALAIDNSSLYEAARRAVVAREDVLAIVSHDLRNPLSAIRTSASLLVRTADQHAAGRLIETIQRASGRMERLIRDLLDLAAIQAGRLTIVEKPEDPREIIAEALELQEPLAREKELRLVADVALAPVAVRCDRERVLQVFSNLLGNAIKFCRRGETITVRAAVRDRELEITVADTGPGIAPAELPHVFDPYWSARRHARRGTGLGLYITKGIVDAHGGTIRADSTIGVGSSFTFTLPLETVTP
ncbi:sensor histidine kinase [Sandaracinus amylolyticus]|uniref:sensor histidine kinase n=1 Tax=Sandaracinus amylolyticus TaxID=927083 RepID=UPI001F1749BF|nr:ATP-binding protein [Sandaracinus amylolyticus]UJR87041.1 Hypothetical protein I5071_91420 [Sandaracinus amylolyticus]